jgi:hypothetical protein
MSKKQKMIALVDTLWDGHHATYLKLFAQTLLELGHEVIVLCPAPIEINQWIADNCRDRQDHFYSFELQEPKLGNLPSESLQIGAMKLSCWRQLAQTIKKISSDLGKSIDLTFLAFLDSYVGTYVSHLIIDRIFPYHWSGLYFHPNFLRVRLKYESMRHGFLNPLSPLKSSYCPTVAVLDEGVVEKLQQRINKPIITFPDFGDDSPPEMDCSLVKQILVKANGRTIIGLVGGQDKRKGFLTLLRVSQRANSSWFFIFTGRFIESTFEKKELSEIQSIIQQNPENCLFSLTQIKNESQYNAIIKSCDILYCGHEKFFHSSNTLTKAAIFEKPVISGNDHCIGERVKNFDLGYRIEAGNVDQCVALLESLAEEFAIGKFSIQPDFVNYRKLHSIEHLKSSFQKVLECF